MSKFPFLLLFLYFSSKGSIHFSILLLQLICGQSGWCTWPTSPKRLMQIGPAAQHSEKETRETFSHGNCVRTQLLGSGAASICPQCCQHIGREQEERVQEMWSLGRSNTILIMCYLFITSECLQALCSSLFLSNFSVKMGSAISLNHFLLMNLFFQRFVNFSWHNITMVISIANTITIHHCSRHHSLTPPGSRKLSWFWQDCSHIFV